MGGKYKKKFYDSVGSDWLVSRGPIKAKSTCANIMSSSMRQASDLCRSSRLKNDWGRVLSVEKVAFSAFVLEASSIGLATGQGSP